MRYKEKRVTVVSAAPSSPLEEALNQALAYLHEIERGVVDIMVTEIPGSITAVIVHVAQGEEENQ